MADITYNYNKGWHEPTIQDIQLAFPQQMVGAYGTPDVSTADRLEYHIPGATKSVNINTFSSGDPVLDLYRRRTQGMTPAQKLRYRKSEEWRRIQRDTNKAKELNSSQKALLDRQETFRRLSQGQQRAKWLASHHLLLKSIWKNKQAGKTPAEAIQSAFEETTKDPNYRNYVLNNEKSTQFLIDNVVGPALAYDAVRHGGDKNTDFVNNNRLNDHPLQYLIEMTDPTTTADAKHAYHAMQTASNTGLGMFQYTPGVMFGNLLAKPFTDKQLGPNNDTFALAGAMGENMQNYTLPAQFVSKSVPAATGAYAFLWDPLRKPLQAAKLGKRGMKVLGKSYAAPYRIPEGTKGFGKAWAYTKNLFRPLTQAFYPAMYPLEAYGAYNNLKNIVDIGMHPENQTKPLTARDSIQFREGDDIIQADPMDLYNGVVDAANQGISSNLPQPDNGVQPDTNPQPPDNQQVSNNGGYLESLYNFDYSNPVEWATRIATTAGGAYLGKKLGGVVGGIAGAAGGYMLGAALPGWYDRFIQATKG